MKVTGFLSESSAVPGQRDQPGPVRLIVAQPGHGRALVTRSASREAGAQSMADRGHGSVTSRVVLWLRHAIADSARGWALAAGVHPDLYS